MKKIPDIINRLWNVRGQMEVGALLTCGSGIIVIKKLQTSRFVIFSRGFEWRITNLKVCNFFNRVCMGNYKPLRFVCGQMG